MNSTDHLRARMRLFESATGSVVWAADYEAFGKAYTYVPGSSEPPSISINMRFPGQYYDAETGLHYNGARFYDPNTGRFLQPEPLVEDPWANLFYGAVDGRQLNPYAYGLGNPLSVVDPSGDAPWTLVIRIARAGIEKGATLSRKAAREAALRGEDIGHEWQKARREMAKEIGANACKTEKHGPGAPHTHAVDAEGNRVKGTGHIFDTSKLKTTIAPLLDLNDNGRLDAGDIVEFFNPFWFPLTGDPVTD